MYLRDSFDLHVQAMQGEWIMYMSSYMYVYPCLAATKIRWILHGKAPTDSRDGSG